MDEPLSNLDARLRVQMRGELKRLQHQLKTTTIYVTHDQAEAMTLAHRVAVMSKGRLQQFDSPMNIYERPTNKFVAEFVGSPSMNFIDGLIDFDRWEFNGPGITLRLSETQLLRVMNGRSNRVTLGIRPEHIIIHSGQTPGGLTARVYVTELMGNETFVFLTIDKQKLIARAPAEFRAEEESVVWLKLVNEQVHFFDSATQERIS
jgi:multiple sugar transport system ATP-binding protein